MKKLALVLMIGVLACSDDDDGTTDDPMTPPENVDDGLAAPEAGRGIQYKMITELQPGSEVEHCQFVQAPAEGLLVNRDEVRFNSGSHHFLLYQTSYTTIPTAKEDGTPVDTSGVFDCSSGATDGWRVEKLVGGSQNGDGDAILAFPEGVAVRVPPGAVLLMNAHYINATDQVLRPEIRINLHTIPEAELQVEGDILFLYNPFIRVPAMGTGRARWRCPVHEDITVANVQSHMHRRGVGYSARIVGQEPFYESDKWEDVPVRRFEPGLQVSAGSWFDYHCDYRETEGRDVYQGARSTDEMCMLIGSYYPANPATAACTDQSGNFAGVWVGNGTATCAQTLGCAASAFQAPDVVRAVSDCVDAARPEVADDMSAALNCMFVAQGDAATACQAQIAACQAR